MTVPDASACLALLRRAEDMLLEACEPVLAAHLSLVIERLAERTAAACDARIHCAG